MYVHMDMHPIADRRAHSWATLCGGCALVPVDVPFRMNSYPIQSNQATPRASGACLRRFTERAIGEDTD